MMEALLKKLQNIEIPSLRKKIAELVESSYRDDSNNVLVIGCPKDVVQELERLIVLHNLDQECKIVLTNPNRDFGKARYLESVQRIIPVISGKGGVGKSTVAFNLAVSLAELGYKVGICDIDIYGPSLPTLSGISKKPVLEDAMMMPWQKFGIKMMSAGFLINKDDALIWRGPMATRLLYQLMRQTKWAEHEEPLHYMIVDTPPGTGDILLSLMENYKLDGAVVVTTPHDLAISDVKRSCNMLGKMGVKITGIVMNQAYLEHDGQKIEVFGKASSGQNLAKTFSTEVLAQMPISQEIATSASSAKPLCFYKPNHPVSKIFEALAIRITEKMDSYISISKDK